MKQLQTDTLALNGDFVQVMTLIISLEGMNISKQWAEPSMFKMYLLLCTYAMLFQRLYNVNNVRDDVV